MISEDLFKPFVELKPGPKLIFEAHAEIDPEFINFDGDERKSVKLSEIVKNTNYQSE